jgi:chromate transporter
MSGEHRVPISAAFRVWLRIGLLGFGGPAGQIALMQEELVDRRRWISQERFLHALNFCMLLPGPEAQQLAIYAGWLLHRTPGGLVAGTLFVLPGALVVLILSAFYARFGGVGVVAALFEGLKPAVIAIIVDALLAIGKRALHGPGRIALAIAAYVGIAFYAVPFPLIVLGAGLAGFALRLGPATGAAQAVAGGVEYAVGDVAARAAHTRPSWGRALRTLAIGIALWWAPVLALAIALGRTHVVVREGIFFGQVAVVTFGGAYAVLAYVTQAAVARFGWLGAGQMLDGLGLAETTPGPLILVTQFVGFLGAYHHPGSLDPMIAGVLGAALTTWVTFAPCFLWIFLGAPFIEGLRGQARLSSALAAITAAVVGVILNLSLWFALHTLFGRLDEARVLGAHLLIPAWVTLDGFGLAIAIAAFAALRVLRFRIPVVVLIAALAGLARMLLAR